jgi:Protein of unknown function (DUF2958)
MHIRMTKKRLLPGFIRKRLPTYEAIADLPREELVAQVKFFYPDFGWTWFGIAFDGNDIFYGLVNGFEQEFGAFSLSELMANRGKLGCEIERDLYFTPTPVARLLRVPDDESGFAPLQRFVNA